ncbi:hypothetical protein D6D28_04826 [Aureobasidium pullulans]|uniref:Uncharacterized protein n=1 Tax=Aureobasidium pullulans TaxID=5580 RepID=A0A4S8SJS8_AURPU|nr:hypothetical protein D6D28_04826 [Aureobasidium pullulans]
MSVTVLAPTPVLSPVRRASMWEKMFGNFKMGKEIVPVGDSGLLSPTISIQKTRMASVSTAIDQKNEAYNRKPSVSTQMAKDTRSCSEGSPSKTRAFSISSRRTSKSSSRRPSWFRSANPDMDSEVPAVPAIDRKFSLFGSHNPDSDVENTSPMASPTTSRRPSYVPRNAASSFLRTTTPLSADEKAEVCRRASVADQAVPVPTVAFRSMSMASPSRAHKPAPLTFVSAPASHGLHSMEGACEIDDSASDLVSPRGGTFSIASAPRSPADTIMEDPVTESQVDSAKASPELNPTKGDSTVAVVELTC